MSHANKVNETPSDDYKCSVSEFDSTNEIALGKICADIRINLVPLNFVQTLSFHWVVWNEHIVEWSHI